MSGSLSSGEVDAVAFVRAAAATFAAVLTGVGFVVAVSAEAGPGLGPGPGGWPKVKQNRQTQNPQPRILMHKTLTNSNQIKKINF